MISAAAIHAATLEKVARKGRRLLSVGELFAFAGWWVLFACIAAWSPDYSSNDAFSSRLDIPPSAVDLFPGENAFNHVSGQTLAPASQVAMGLGVFHLLTFLTAVSSALRRRWRMFVLCFAALCIPSAVFGVARGAAVFPFAAMALAVGIFTSARRLEWRCAIAMIAAFVLLIAAQSITSKPGPAGGHLTAEQARAYVVAQQAYLENDPVRVAEATSSLVEGNAYSADMPRLIALRKYAAANGALGEGEKQQLAQQATRARMSSVILGSIAALFMAISSVLEGFSALIGNRMRRLADETRQGGRTQYELR